MKFLYEDATRKGMKVKDIIDDKRIPFLSDHSFVTKK